PDTTARSGRSAHIDPVCGMTVDPTKNKGGSFDHAGTTYYFCSPGCNTKFQSDPDGWLEKRRQKDLLKNAEPKNAEPKNPEQNPAPASAKAPAGFAQVWIC